LNPDRDRLGQSLLCEKCGAETDDAATGWIAHLPEDVEGLEPMSVAVFCPECARVEFGYPAEEQGEQRR
jgi:hypothetical protein